MEKTQAGAIREQIIALIKKYKRIQTETNLIKINTDSKQIEFVEKLIK